MNSGRHRGSHMHMHMLMRMSLNPISSQSLTVLFIYLFPGILSSQTLIRTFSRNVCMIPLAATGRRFRARRTTVRGTSKRPRA